MGSRNDYAVMRGTVEVLKEFGVAHEVQSSFGTSHA